MFVSKSEKTDSNLVLFSPLFSITAASLIAISGKCSLVFFPASSRSKSCNASILVKKREKTVDIGGSGPPTEKTFLKTIYSAPARCKERRYL